MTIETMMIVFLLLALICAVAWLGVQLLDLRKGMVSLHGSFMLYAEMMQGLSVRKPRGRPSEPKAKQQESGQVGLALATSQQNPQSGNG